MIQHSSHWMKPMRSSSFCSQIYPQPRRSVVVLTDVMCGGSGGRALAVHLVGSSCIVSAPAAAVTHLVRLLVCVRRYQMLSFCSCYSDCQTDCQSISLLLNLGLHHASWLLVQYAPASCDLLTLFVPVNPAEVKRYMASRCKCVDHFLARINVFFCISSSKPTVWHSSNKPQRRRTSK